MKIPNPAYFARKLKTFLHERHPLLEKTDEMIRIRSNKAWNVAWNRAWNRVQLMPYYHPSAI